FVRLTSYTSAGSRDLCPCPTRRSSDLCADRALRGGAREGMVERTGGAPGVAAEPPQRRRQPSEAQRQQPETLDRARAPIIPLELDRKSTRLNSSHGSISYAVFCLKKNK